MNNKTKLEELIASLPKEVQNNFEQNKDKYLTFQYVSTQILDRLLRTYLFHVNTRYQKDLPSEIYKNADFYCNTYRIPKSLFLYIADMALYILVGMGSITNEPVLEEWFEELMNKVDKVDGVDTSSTRPIMKRPKLDVGENPSNEEIKEAVKKDLLTMFSEEEVDEMIKNLKITDGMVYLSMDSVGKGSYNKGRKKDENNAKS